MNAGLVASGALLVFVMLAVTCDISLRYLLNMPLLWVVEFSTFALVAITFFAAAWLLKREGHVSMDQLYNRQSPKTQGMLTTVTSILSALCCLAIVYYGMQVTVDHYLSGDKWYTVMETPKWPISAIVVLGYLLLFLQFIRRIRHSIAVWQGKEAVATKRWQ